MLKTESIETSPHDEIEGVTDKKKEENEIYDIIERDKEEKNSNDRF